MIQAHAGPPVARPHSLRSVSLLVPDPEAMADFYTGTWGLTATERGEGTAWLRGSSREHHILHLARNEQNALGKIVFAVRDRREVDDAARALAALDILLVHEPGPLDDAAGGYGLQFVDPEGRLVELSTELYAVSERDANGREAVPRKIAHVVLNTVDIDAACAFYTRVLGMRVSDWSEHQMAFLRCNNDHHVIAFNQGDWTSLNHVAYEMPSIDHFMRGIGNLRRSGITPEWGPGRHGPGDNTFSYFTDPAGLVCEYTSEVAQIEEDSWLCRVWPRTAELSDQWGTAGPPTQTVRTHMAGVPDLGYLSRHKRAS
ncbi:VOC family protein [Leekyejoonella antrihumi]|uniref:Extradiol ring-cleavage dioxygenase n=1 Tax=Leekyejoonella antrihumi TaxID=1660198 RepID=A0A563DXH7_9MICO|nr:VOC family protein [Leekyejoonella antrihumi]TWP34681.1 extradiol ring-cleavage dioxygenase [Leekyejoonella antrihumi]